MLTKFGKTAAVFQTYEQRQEELILLSGVALTQRVLHLPQAEALNIPYPFLQVVADKLREGMSGHPSPSRVPFNYVSAFQMLAEIIAKSILNRTADAREAHFLQVQTYRGQTLLEDKAYVLSRLVTGYPQQAPDPFAKSVFFDTRKGGQDNRAALTQSLQKGEYAIYWAQPGNCSLPVKNIPQQDLAIYGLSAAQPAEDCRLTISSDFLAPFDLGELVSYPHVSGLLRCLHAEFLLVITTDYADRKGISYNRKEISHYLSDLTLCKPLRRS
jgi:hypothetical protein